MNNPFRFPLVKCSEERYPKSLNKKVYDFSRRRCNIVLILCIICLLDPRLSHNTVTVVDISVQWQIKHTGHINTLQRNPFFCTNHKSSKQIWFVCFVLHKSYYTKILMLLLPWSISNWSLWVLWSKSEGTKGSRIGWFNLWVPFISNNPQIIHFSIMYGLSNTTIPWKEIAWSGNFSISLQWDQCTFVMDKPVHRSDSNQGPLCYCYFSIR